MLIYRLPLAVVAALPLYLVAESPTKPPTSPATPLPTQTAPAKPAPKSDRSPHAESKPIVTSNNTQAAPIANTKQTAAIAVSSQTAPAESNKASAEALKVETTAAKIPSAEGIVVLPTLQHLAEQTSRLNAEKEKLLAELALAQAKLDLELASTKQNTERLNAQIAELKAKQELAEFKDKISLQSSLAKLRADLEKATLTSNLAKAKVETEIAEIKQLENLLKKDTARIAASIELEEKQAESRNYANNQPIYLENPLKDNRLILSDRRIPLNSVITMNTAAEIVDQINYFNNRDRKMPIFIVIDDCPGGSVMAGYKILKAMHGSQAPVYVVVKSFAASMAACITTLAEKSFAYPNAVILHHQISSFSGGNLTQQQEWVKEMEEWWKRLAGPVADKMGITREEFIKLMYEHSSSGDWKEFADQAQKLKWVDIVVEEIEETGTLRLNSKDKTESQTIVRRTTTTLEANAELTETVDAKGRPSMVLPRLNPFDCYWLYNPDGYFKLP